ncbi:MAG: CDP-alcohol phosphatidyltransferase family protein [Actinomycetales bacterium]
MRLIGAGTREGKQTVHDAVLTVPNIITVVRFLGVPLFVWLLLGRQEYGWAVIVLILIGGTDWVDGYVARRFDQASKLGTIMDPVADRVALFVVAISLVVAGIAPWWLVAVLIVPDALLLAVALTVFNWRPNLPVSRIGKVRTALLLAGTPLLLLARVVSAEPNPLYVAAWVLLAAAIAGHLVAAVNYFRAIMAARRGRAGPIGAGDDDGGRP